MAASDQRQGRSALHNSAPALSNSLRLVQPANPVRLHRRHVLQSRSVGDSAHTSALLARHTHGVELADEVAKDDGTVTAHLIDTDTDTEKQASEWIALAGSLMEPNRRNLVYKSFILVRVMNSQQNAMLRIIGKFGIASATAIAIAIASITVSTPASARYGGGWHGGGWHGDGGYGGHGGWAWGGFGLGFGTSLLLGAAPYYGGYYGYSAYAYDYYEPPRCYISRRWVWDRCGRRESVTDCPPAGDTRD